MNGCFEVLNLSGSPGFSGKFEVRFPCGTLIIYHDEIVFCQTEDEDHRPDLIVEYCGPGFSILREDC